MARTIEQMLEHQARLWDKRRELGDRGTQVQHRTWGHLSEGPWVTLSRQLGSNGNEVARLLAQDLGWQVFDKEILQEIAKTSHLQEAVLEQLDQHDIGPFRDYLNQVILPRATSQPHFFQQMTEATWSIAKKGHAVIVGRGANWYLDSRYGFRVRLVAPVEARVQRTAEREGIDPKPAEAKVRENDEEQRAFIKRSFHRDIDDSLGYDVVVNTEHLRAAKVAQLLRLAMDDKLRSREALRPGT